MKIVSAMSMEDGTMALRLDADNLLERHVPELFIHEVARLFAERYVADHYQEIVALIDQKAIATLSVAEAGVAIRRTLAEKLPDKIVEVVRTDKEVYQRGIFGGMRRIR